MPDEVRRVIKSAQMTDKQRQRFQSWLQYNTLTHLMPEDSIAWSYRVEAVGDSIIVRIPFGGMGSGVVSIFDDIFGNDDDKNHPEIYGRTL